MKSLGLIPHKRALNHALAFSDQSIPNWIDAPTLARIEATAPSQRSDFTGKSHYDAILGVCVSNNPELQECSHPLRRSEEEEYANECLSSPTDPPLLLSLKESVDVLDVLHTASRDFTDFFFSKYLSGTTETHHLRSQYSRGTKKEQNWNYFECIKNVSEEIATEASCKPLFSLLPRSAQHPLMGHDANMLCGITSSSDL